MRYYWVYDVIIWICDEILSWYCCEMFVKLRMWWEGVDLVNLVVVVMIDEKIILNDVEEFGEKVKWYDNV